MNPDPKIYRASGSKFGTCPKCGHRNGLNPFRADRLSRATYTITGHKVIHHKCKKCLWQGYVMVNSDSVWGNRIIHAAYYVFWLSLGLGIPTFVYLKFLS